jgi:type IV secretion system protein TrbC
MRNADYLVAFGLIAVALVLTIDPALAQATSDLPWVSPLEKIQASLTGTVARTIAILGIFASGALLIFGGEFNDFTKLCIKIALAGSLMIGAPSIVDIFTTTTGN